MEEIGLEPHPNRLRHQVSITHPGLQDAFEQLRKAVQAYSSASATRRKVLGGLLKRRISTAQGAVAAQLASVLQGDNVLHKIAEESRQIWVSPKGLIRFTNDSNQPGKEWLPIPAASVLARVRIGKELVRAFPSIKRRVIKPVITRVRIDLRGRARRKIA